MLLKGKMKIIRSGYVYRIGIDKNPAISSHKIECIYHGIEIGLFTIIGFKPVVFPEIFLFTEVDVKSYFIA